MERLFKLVYFAGMLAQIILRMPYERQRRLDGGLLPDDERIAKEWQRISLRKVKCCISHTVQVRGGLTCARLPTTM